MTGFRLDTLATCKQYTAPVVRGMEVLTTRTDFVSKNPSMLQTTSYNTKTTTTGEVCVGVVKAAKFIKRTQPGISLTSAC